MKLIAIAVSVFSAVNSQALTAECGLGNLIVDIPYPDERTAKLLYLTAGTCNETNYAGSTFYDDTKSVFQITIPIEPCGLKDELYGTPVSRSTGGLYMPTANVTLGEKMGSMDVIFRNMVISAECGLKTSYRVGFNYSEIASSDKEGCHEVNGVCVFPAYETGVELEIKEYTDDTFTTVIDDSNQDLRHKLAGQTIYLSMRGSVPDGYKYAVSDCSIVTDSGTKFMLMEPGAATGATCGLDGVGLTAFYDSGNFNFQHILFLLEDAATVSSFRLECRVEVCNRDDASSKCNQAAAVCINDSTDVSDSAAVAAGDEMIKEYMCDGLCGAEFDCVIENNSPVCRTSWKGPPPVRYTPGLGTQHYCTGCTGDVFYRTSTCDSSTPEMCTVWLNYLKSQSWSKPSDISVVSWRLTGELIDDYDLIEAPGMLESASRDIQLELESMQLRYLTPYFLNSPHVTYILLKGTRIRNNNPTYAKEVADRQAICSNQPSYEASMSLTADSFHKESFAGFPNLKSFKWYTGANVNLWDLGVDYWVTAIPKLEKIELSYINMGKECYCQDNPPATINDLTPGCGRCETIRFCEQLCGLHPTLKSCNESPNSDSGSVLTCDKALTNKHNGTWTKGWYNIKDVIENCGYTWHQDD